MNRIAVPVDLSKSSLEAYRFALDLARKNKADLDLIHVLEQPGVNSWTISDKDLRLPQHIASNIFFIKLVEKTKEDLAEFKNSENTDGVDVKTHLRMGKAYQNIADVISECNADLVIMGSNGEDEFIDTIIGSNAEKVVRKSECPVLIIKEHLELEQLKDIVLASEFNEHIDPLVEFLVELQELLDVRLHLLLVSTPSNFETTFGGKKRIDTFIKKHNLKNCESHVYSDFSEEEGIISYAHSIGAEMIAMTTNGNSPFVQFFAGSIAAEVVNTARRAVLTIKLKK